MPRLNLKYHNWFREISTNQEEERFYSNCVDVEALRLCENYPKCSCDIFGLTFPCGLWRKLEERPIFKSTTDSGQQSLATGTGDLVMNMSAAVHMCK